MGSAEKSFRIVTLSELHLCSFQRFLSKLLMCCLQSRLADNYCSKAFLLCFEFTNLGLKSYSLVFVIRPPFSAAISHASRLDSSTRYTDKSCSWPQYLQLEQYKVRWVRDCKFRGAHGCSQWSQEGTWALWGLNGSQWFEDDEIFEYKRIPASWRVGKRLVTHLWRWERKEKKRH